MIYGTKSRKIYNVKKFRIFEGGGCPDFDLLSSDTVQMS
jgi:hypothetical protein